MKGYKKSLEKFIEYVFDKYAEDEEVQNFQATYFIRKQEKLAKKQQKTAIIDTPAQKVIKISSETARLCRRMILDTMGTLLFFNCSDELITNLKAIYNELGGNFGEGL